MMMTTKLMNVAMHS